MDREPLRHIMLDGEPWFVAADVCRILDLPFGKGVGSTTRHLKRLDPSEKQHVGRARVNRSDPWPNNGASCVNESGLYKLIMRSDKDTARPFQDWVTKEVLPAIRHTGGYLLNEAARETAHADTREAMPLPKNGQLVLTLGERTFD